MIRYTAIYFLLFFFFFGKNKSISQVLTKIIKHTNKFVDWKQAKKKLKNYRKQQQNSSGEEG